MKALSAIVVLVILAVGCSSSSGETKGYTKEDFAKSDPPPNWGPPPAPPSATAPPTTGTSPGN